MSSPTTKLRASLRCLRAAVLLPLLVAGTFTALADVQISGPLTLCPGETNSYSVITDATNNTFAWTLGPNSAGAEIVGDTNLSQVTVTVAVGGGFTLECLVESASTNELATTNISVGSVLTANGPTNATACPGDTIVLVADVTGGGAVDFVWLKDGLAMANASSSTLTLTNVTSADAGEYGVEIRGSCNALTNFATVGVIHPSTPDCPTNLTVQCFADVPPPDNNAVITTNATLVLHLGDEAVTNACEIAISRTYAVVNSCGTTSTCVQLILVQDTTPPVFNGITNLVVEYGTSWSFIPPTATDNCGNTNINLVVSSTLTNATCGKAYESIRTWTALDACSNAASFTQTVAVVDTVPPVLNCPPNLTVEFGTPWNFANAFATDNSQTNMLVYDNTVNDLAFQLDLAGLEAGNEIRLADEARFLQSFSYEFWSKNLTGSPFYEGTNVTVRLRFYANDGPGFLGYSTPGTLLYDSGEFWLGPYTTPRAVVLYNEYDLWLYAAYPLMVEMPSNFTWTVQFSGLGTNDQAGVDLYSPPVIGAAYNDFWLRTETGWELRTNAGVAAPMAAQAWATTNQIPVTVLSTVTNIICGNAYEVTRTWRATDECGNSSEGSQTISVVDTTPPTLTGWTNQVVECGTPWDFEAPLVTDLADGTNVLLTIEATVTNALCGTTFFATRTWRATDSCSNVATFSQTVTLVDTTPPALICAPNRVVECGDVWDFEPPTASDVCGATNVTVEILATTTNQLTGPTFSATRVWQATDACGNTNSCSQTILIVDTTPPQIVCSTNIVVECEGGIGTVVSFTVTAFDGCDTNLTIVSTPPSGSAFALGTNLVNCTASDSNQNTNYCSFEVVVMDTIPPQILCPPDMIVSEAPRDSGGAVVTFPPPTVLDICDSAPALTALPASGSIFPVGTNLVTWTAVDSSGNSNACTFTVRVIPYRLLVVSNTDDAGPGSLRQAILDGNDAPDENLIIFNLPGAGPYTINLLSPLPSVTSPTIFDGWSQSGSNTAPVVELAGASNAFDGLVIHSGPSVVQGLAFHGFATAIRIEGAGTNVIQGNYLGVDHTGTNAPGNSGDAIHLDSSFNRIGGTNAGTANLIGGNGGNGITLSSAGASGTVIQGNRIGVTTNGSPLPNAAHGVFLTNQAAGNLIGGLSSGAANWIGYNGGAGVALDVSAGTGNAVLRNSISENGALGLDLGADGITPNDAGDAETGPNGWQNYPILSDARSIDGFTIIEGELSSTPNTSFHVEFFLNDTADPSTNGEGRVYVGSTQVDVQGGGTATFSASYLLTAVFTQFITATATDPEGNTSEFSPAVQVRTPPIIEAQPQGTNTTTGESITLCAQVSGTPPIQYQWRLNGVNLPDATNACYTITNAALADGGTYQVVVRNELAAFPSATAPVLLYGTNIFNPGLGDNFADAVPLSGYGNGTNGVIVGNNALATLEPLEPFHAGKPGGRSVWYRWCVPEGSKGIATFRTSGSTFDTLLAVYQGDSLSNLVEIASGEDDARYYTSEVRFNAFYKSASRSCYYIAVDAFDGVGGEFVLSWNEIKTSHMLPVILTHPASATVLPGASVTFTNRAVPECSNGHLDCNNLTHWAANDNKKEKLTYQWYFNDVAIPGATNSSFTIPSVQAEQVGEYRVRVFTPWQYLDSRKATLQINLTGDNAQQVQAVDKFLDLELTAPLLVGFPFVPASIQPPSEGPAIAAAGTVARGYTGTQIFNTTGTATDPGEVICGVIGGSSEWLTLLAEQTGTLFLNTDGSSYDTVMAIFQRNPLNPSSLILLACDNNAGLDGRDSSVVIPVTGGTTNYILVDGVNGASGILYLNYSLATATILNVAGRTADGANIIQVNGRPALNFSIQTSANLKTWTTLVTTNAPTGVLTYTDTSSIGQPVRYYRALIKP